MCPNKNDKNWKIMVNALGETGAYAVYTQYGMPDLVNSNIYKNGNGKVNQGKLVMAALTDMYTADYAPGEVNDFNNVASNLELRIHQMDRKIAEAKNKKDYVKVDQYERAKNRIEEDLEEVKVQNSYERVLEQGKKDLDRIESIFEMDSVSHADLNVSFKIVNMWRAGAEHLMKPEDRSVLESIAKEFAMLQERANVLENRLGDMNTDILLEAANQLNGQSTTQQLVEDIGGMKRDYLDVSRISDTIYNFLFRSVKKGNTIIESKVKAIEKRMKELYKPIKDLKPYELLAQQYENGDKTGGLITKIKPEYTELKFKLRRDYLNAPSKTAGHIAKSKYIDFLKKEEITFDVRKLYGDMAGKEAHITELKAVLKEVEFDRRMSLLDKKVDEYRKDYASMATFYEAKYPGSVGQALLRTWEIENSPFEWMNYLDNHRSPTFKDKSLKGFIRTDAVPKSDKWSDPRFKVIENNKDLAAYYTEVMNVLSDMRDILPESKRNELKSNSIPFMEKSVSEIYNQQGFKGIASSFYSSFIGSVRAKDNDIFYGYQDLVSGEEDGFLKPPAVEDVTRVNDLHKMKIAEHIKETGNRPTQPERDAYYREARKEVAESKSFDLNAIMIGYATMAESYRHKASQEDTIQLIKYNILKQQEYDGVNKDGSPHKKSDSTNFVNAKLVAGNHIDVAFYGKGTPNEGVSKTEKLTASEQKERDHIDSLLKTPGLNDVEKESLTRQRNAIGGNVVASKIGDRLLNFTQLKGMAFNGLGAFANVMFGTVSNITHGAGGEDYSFSNYLKGLSLSLANIKDSAQGKASKINVLMEKFQVVADSKNESMGTAMSKMLEKAGVYAFNTKTEHFNQSAILVAMMMEQGLWDKFNEDGEYIGEGDFSVESNNFQQFKVQLDDVIKMLHGNYDGDSPVNVKNKFIGRAVSQFRTWMFESIYNRFGEEYFDQNLNRVKKGRYRTIWENKKYRTILPLFADMYNSFFNQSVFEKDVDAANMRKNTVELGMYLTLVAVLLMLSGGDDDDKKSFVRNMLINQLLRVQTDISFYLNPMSAEALTKQAVPAMSVVTDAFQLLHASGQFLAGNDEIKNGVFAGDSRIVRESAQFFPLLNQIPRVYSSGSQLFDK